MVSITAIEVKLTQKPVLQMQRLSTSMLDLFPAKTESQSCPSDTGSLLQMLALSKSDGPTTLWDECTCKDEQQRLQSPVSTLVQSPKCSSGWAFFFFYSLSNWTHGSVQASLGTDSVAQASSVALLPCHPWVSIITGLHDQARLLHCSYPLPTRPLKFILSHIADIRNILGFT